MSKTPSLHVPQARQPVIAVLGHVDHGKSSLLDFIRKTNLVEGEAGGITQRISAYEVEVLDEKKRATRLTFLDTPGHEAFQSMRERGVEIADIAILIVSAEDGVKAQTLEAYKTIAARKLPFVVAINKIDKPGADIQKTKNSLVENGIYIEGYGGDIPCVELSAKVGTGVPLLLETLQLMATMQEFTWNANDEATGYVLESFVDQKRGISATLIIKDGTLPTGGAVVAGTALSPIRIIEDFTGKPIKSPVAGQAVKVTGFDEIPASGSIFMSYSDKKEAERLRLEAKADVVKEVVDPRIYRNAKVVVPLVLKADSLGTLEAVKRELKKRETDDVKVKLIGAGVGNITEGDILLASSDEKTLVLGFTVKLESKGRDQAERFGIKPELFDVIYKLGEWFDGVIEERLPFEEVEEVTGKLTLLKTFSTSKDKHVIGGKVTEGRLLLGALVKIERRGFELGKGKIIELQSMKVKVKEVTEGNECGLMVEAKMEMIPGDTITSINVIKKKLA